jgi:hypothetical protein
LFEDKARSGNEIGARKGYIVGKAPLKDGVHDIDHLGRLGPERLRRASQYVLESIEDRFIEKSVFRFCHLGLLVR